MNEYKHPETCFSHDQYNNCTIIKWGEGGYFKTDYPEGEYTDEVVDELNSKYGVTPNMRSAMELCSEVAQTNPSLDWEELYIKQIDRIIKLLQNKAEIERCFDELIIRTQEYRINGEKSYKRLEESFMNFKFAIGIEGTDQAAMEEVLTAIQTIVEDKKAEQYRKAMAN